MMYVFMVSGVPDGGIGNFLECSLLYGSADLDLLVWLFGMPAVPKSCLVLACDRCSSSLNECLSRAPASTLRGAISNLRAVEACLFYLQNQEKNDTQFHFFTRQRVTMFSRGVLRCDASKFSGLLRLRYVQATSRDIFSSKSRRMYYCSSW